VAGSICVERCVDIGHLAMEIAQVPARSVMRLQNHITDPRFSQTSPSKARRASWTRDVLPTCSVVPALDASCVRST
jgi:hypothetical protein